MLDEEAMKAMQEVERARETQNQNILFRKLQLQQSAAGNLVDAGQKAAEEESVELKEDEPTRAESYSPATERPGISIPLLLRSGIRLWIAALQFTESWTPNLAVVELKRP